MSELQLEIANEQQRVKCDEEQLYGLIEFVLREESELKRAHVSLAVADEELTREVNRNFLDRTGTTDVISFTYHRDETDLEGEIVVNADEAVRQADDAEHDHPVELLLYVVHGVLHLLGYEDSTPELWQRMNGRAVELLRTRGYELDSRNLLEDH